ncbi:MAG: hypothetical protein ACRDOX_01625 [Nocardioides sp.]
MRFIGCGRWPTRIAVAGWLVGRFRPLAKEVVVERRTGAKPFAMAVAVVGVIMIVAGGVTWFVVQDQLVAGEDHRL